MSADPITFTVVGEPIGKARARILRNGGAYTPARTTQHETALKWAAKVVMRGRERFMGPCSVVAAFEMPIPTSWSQAKRVQALTGQLVPRGKPDIDNLAKALLDSLNTIVLNDDAAVIHLEVHKRYSLQPKTICTVRGL